MKRSLEIWLKQAAQSKWAEFWLGVCAFLNSFVLPIPAETLLIPLCLARREQSWRFAGVATVAAVLGGLTGYAIGAVAYAAIGALIIDFYNATEAFERAKEQFNAAGPQWILLATITPLPYKVVTITSGAAGMNLGLFIAASLVGRFIGYFLIAGLAWRFGDAALNALRSPAIQVAAFLALLIGAYFLIF